MAAPQALGRGGVKHGHDHDETQGRQRRHQPDEHRDEGGGDPGQGPEPLGPDEGGGEPGQGPEPLGPDEGGGDPGQGPEPLGPDEGGGDAGAHVQVEHQERDAGPVCPAATCPGAARCGPA
jgi:hypothetical protein